jgi:hypothetical protein
MSERELHPLQLECGYPGKKVHAPMVGHMARQARRKVERSRPVTAVKRVERKGIDLPGVIHCVRIN